MPDPPPVTSATRSLSFISRPPACHGDEKPKGRPEPPLGSDRRVARRLAGGGGRLLLPSLARARRSLTLVGLGRLLGLGVLLPLLLGRLGPVHQLEHDHGGAIARARAGMDDPGIAAVPVREPRRDGVEELLHHRLVGNHGQHLALGVEVLALGERHHLVGEPAHRLGLGLGGHDALVAEERHQQVAKQRPAVLGDPPELVVRPAVPHFAPPRPSAPSTLGSIRIPSDRPRLARAVLISSMDFSPRFFTFSRSASVFWTRSATVRISALRSALMARAGNGSSSSTLDRLSWRKPSPSASTSSSSSGPPSG